MDSTNQLELAPRAMEITITGLPVPPSVNQLYAYVCNRLIKTKSYKLYEHATYKWLTVNPEQIRNVRTFFKDIGDHVIHVDAIFHMKRKDVICKTGKPKKNDTSNRLKALHDILGSVIIGVDDSYFWSGSFEKIAIDDSGEPSVDITFKLRKI